MEQPRCKTCVTKASDLKHPTYGGVHTSLCVELPLFSYFASLILYVIPGRYFMVHRHRATHKSMLHSIASVVRQNPSHCGATRRSLCFRQSADSSSPRRNISIFGGRHKDSEILICERKMKCNLIATRSRFPQH